jgi:hypothetical protein
MIVVVLHRRAHAVFRPSSTASPSYGNVFGAKGTFEGLSTATAVAYTPPRTANPPIKYIAAVFFVTMCGGKLSNAGSGCASPASQVNSASSGSCARERMKSAKSSSSVHRTRAFVALSLVCASTVEVLGEVGQSPIVRSCAHRPGVLARARSSSRATSNDKTTIAPSSRLSRARSIDAVDAPRSWAPPRVPPPVPSPRARSSSRARLVARSSSAKRATRSSRAPRSLRTLVEACRRSTKCNVSAPLTTTFWATHRDARSGRGHAPRALE